MVYQIIAVNKDGHAEKQQLATIVGNVVNDGRRQLGDFFHINEQSVSDLKRIKRFLCLG